MIFEVDDRMIAEAIERIAGTADGELLYRFLQKSLMATMAPAAITEHTLPRFEGRRSFAAELMAMMAKGISPRDRYDAATVTFALSGARRADSGARRPGGRRVTLDTPVPGWDPPDPDAESGG